jgi:hypothetical protein
LIRPKSEQCSKRADSFTHDSEYPVPLLVLRGGGGLVSFFETGGELSHGYLALIPNRRFDMLSRKRSRSGFTLIELFDNIDHTVLLDIIRRDIHDGRLLNLIDGMLKAGVPGGLAAL